MFMLVIAIPTTGMSNQQPGLTNRLRFRRLTWKPHLCRFHSGPEPGTPSRITLPNWFMRTETVCIIAPAMPSPGVRQLLPPSVWLPKMHNIISADIICLCAASRHAVGSCGHRVAAWCNQCSQDVPQKSFAHSASFLPPSPTGLRSFHVPDRTLLGLAETKRLHGGFRSNTLADDGPRH